MFSSDKWFGASPSFYNGVATQSLRFNNADSAYLNRTVAAGNRKTWTLSFWAKIGEGTTTRARDFLCATGSSATELWAIQLISANKIQIYGADAVLLVTNARLRDPNAWYHIVVRCNVPASSDAEKLRIYINGTNMNDTGFGFATDGRSSLDESTDYGINANIDHHIGANQTPGNYFYGNLAEYNFIDGTSLGPDSFGETKNGVWIPKEYTGSYGTRGYRLEFKETGTSANSSGLGADTSGNAGHWTPNAINGHDSNLLDSPENNFATLNTLSFLTDNRLTQGNLELNHEVTSHRANTVSIAPLTGKWYFEVYNKNDTAGSTHSIGIGLQDATKILEYGSGNDNYIFYCNNNSAITSLNTTTNSLSSFTPAAGNIMQVAYDFDSGKLFIGKNNTYIAADSGTDGNPATGANPTATLSTSLEYLFYVNIYNNVITCNFGQDPTFANNMDSTSAEKTPSNSGAGTADGNGNGKFFYAPPTGFLALCSANLPEPTIGPNSTTQADDYFNTVLYDGTGSSNSVTGVGFQPDFVWIKKRSGGTNRNSILTDSTRGVTKHLSSVLADEEFTVAQGLTAFGADGFTVGSYDSVNESGNSDKYVAWNWKANGGTTSTNDDGDIQSTVQANTTAGFSIVTYTANGSSTDTIGHGLSKQLSMVLIKRTDGGSRSWHVGHKDMPFSSASNSHNGYMSLDDITANATSNGGRANIPNATTFQGESTNNDTMVAYCFAEVEGFSKFGSYTPNNGTDNAFVYTGFRPAFLLVKSTASQEWAIVDNVRDSTNDNSSNVLYANYVNHESTDGSNIVDLLSNGFKIRATASFGYATDIYIYMAFAEAPFKYANAR